MQIVAYIFFPTHPEVTQANGICNEFHYGIFSQIGTVEQGKFVLNIIYTAKTLETRKINK